MNDTKAPASGLPVYSNFTLIGVPGPIDVTRLRQSQLAGLGDSIRLVKRASLPRVAPACVLGDLLALVGLVAIGAHLGQLRLRADRLGFVLVADSPVEV